MSHEIEDYIRVSSDKSWMRKGPDGGYDKQISDTDIL